MATLHDFTLTTIDGEERSLADFDGQVVLVVNVASRCGLTPQYDGLQRLQETYAPRGFSVLGFPCNQFGAQEPGSDAQVKAFCSENYGASFPLFSKIEVNGDGRHPLYAWLTSQDTSPDGSGDIRWNFAKFLVDRKGAVVARFAPPVEPQAGELTGALEAALA